MRLAGAPLALSTWRFRRAHGRRRVNGLGGTISASLHYRQQWLAIAADERFCEAAAIIDRRLFICSPDHEARRKIASAAQKSGKAERYCDDIPVSAIIACSFHGRNETELVARYRNAIPRRRRGKRVASRSTDVNRLFSTLTW